ncbi:MAG: proteasome accessory factor PafA2 family protein, partial [Actinomycetota bacterium]
ILHRSMEAATQILPPGQEIAVYKNNSDRKGNSYGCHENYLMDRSVPFGRIVSHVMPHFVTRQIFCGSGKVGTEAAGLTSSDVPFQLSSRADFFEEEVGLETTLKRPIVNTRDEPHCDAQKYRRLHVIVGDANLSEVATFLKVGTTAVVLSMIEDEFLVRDLTLARPVQAIRHCSYDLTCKKPLELADGSTASPLEIQWEYFTLARKYAEEVGLESMGAEAVGAEILRRWETVLTGLDEDPSSLATQVDWIAKKRLMEGFMERHDVDWSSPKVAALDLQYADLRPSKSLFGRVGMEALVDDRDVERAMTEPPDDTRAYFRGKCLQKWPNDIVAANWDSLVFDIGGDPLRRVPMMEPMRGTRAHVGTLVEECSTSAELLERLGS